MYNEGFILDENIGLEIEFSFLEDDGNVGWVELLSVCRLLMFWGLLEAIGYELIFWGLLKAIGCESVCSFL